MILWPFLHWDGVKGLTAHAYNTGPKYKLGRLGLPPQQDGAPKPKWVKDRCKFLESCTEEWNGYCILNHHLVNYILALVNNGQYSQVADIDLKYALLLMTFAPIWKNYKFCSHFYTKGRQQPIIITKFEYHLNKLKTN